MQCTVPEFEEVGDMVHCAPRGWGCGALYLRSRRLGMWCTVPEFRRLRMWCTVPELQEVGDAVHCT